MRGIDVARHLLDGGMVRDESLFEPGMCSDGGRYGVTYRVIGGGNRDYAVLESCSDYEDASWQQEAAGLPCILRWARSVDWEEPAIYGDWPAWRLS